MKLKTDIYFQDRSYYESQTWISRPAEIQWAFFCLGDFLQNYFLCQFTFPREICKWYLIFPICKLVVKMLFICKSGTTYHLVVVIELHYNIRGPLSNLLGVSINLHVTENQCLIPSGVQCCWQLLCCLTYMQEGDVCIRICEGK